MKKDIREEEIDPKVLKIAFILLIGVLAPLFDTTIMNVALNTLLQDLNATISTVQWVMTGFLLAMGMVIPATGWLSERFGGKRVWMIALFLFMVGSVLSGLSWNVESLIAFRVLQGIGGGIMVPVMMTLIVHAAGGRKLGKLMAIVSMPALLGPILGPVLGGLIVNHLNWRWIFFVNIPICITAFIFAWFGLPAGEPSHVKQRIDIIGLFTLSPALIAVLCGLAQAGAHGGIANMTVIILLITGVLLLMIFIIYALQTKAEPMIDLRLFRSRSFTSSAILSFLSGLTTYGAMLLLPLYYQQVCNKSAVVTGLLLIPQGIGALLTRGRIGKLCDLIGPRSVVLVGNAISIAGTLPFAFAGPHTSQVLLGAALVVRGAGLGGVTIPVMATVYKGLRKDQISNASSASRIMQQVGGSFGAAVFSIILDNQFTGHLAHDISISTVAFDRTFWWAIGFALFTFIPAFFLPGREHSTED